MKAIPSGGDKPDGPKPRVSHVKYDRDAFKDLVSRTFKRVEGKAKTVIDSAVTDPTQRNAAKSLVEQLIWSEYDFFTEVLRNAELA